jgi:hypothetical protein
MTNLQEQILEVFKDFKVSRNGVMNPLSLDMRIKKWDSNSRNDSATAVKELIGNGYISFDQNWYTLLDKGYDHIFYGYSIADTESLILGEFKSRKISIGHRLMRDSLSPLQQSLERFHFDNFNPALKNLILVGLIEIEDRSYKLTQKGYDKIYS